VFFRLHLPLITVAVLCLGLSVHEMGHAAAAYLTGGRVSEFVLFSLRPHVRIAGNATAAAEALRAIAGSACFLLFYAILSVVCPRSREEWRAVRCAASLFAVVELLGWTVSSLAGTASAGPNDAADFVASTQWNRYVVAATAAGIGGIGAAALRAFERRRVRSNSPSSETSSVRPLAKAAAARGA
jgi:hypothetical protein